MLPKRNENALNDAPEIPGYELTGELGHGVSSIVYSATREGKRFAVKIMRRELGERDLRAVLRFRREAAALARMNHPSLIKVAEVGEVDGRPYLVMEEMQGKTLAEILRDGPLRETDFLTLARALASALSEVHRHGLVHRDLKPANIILDPTGMPKIVDFGFVKILGMGGDEGEEIAGSFQYAAPEQSGLLKRPVDTRADLYSLGVVLFEAAAGRTPFRADDVGELMRLHAVVVPPEVAQLQPGFRPVLSLIIQKLLLKDPDQRYQTAEGLLFDLSQLEALEASEKSGAGFRLGDRDFSSRRFYEIPLAGRQEERKRLFQLWDRVRSGQGAIVTIEGEGGSGKTRLSREISRQARQSGAVILSAKCQELERAPFAPLREAADGHLAGILRLPEVERKAALSRLREAAGEYLPWVKLLSTGLGRVLSESSDPAGIQAELDQEQFIDAIAHFFIQFAKAHGSTLLFIDDVQWLDEPSLKVLARMSAHVRTVPLGLIGTARNDAASEAARLRVVNSLGAALSERIVLRPLTLADVNQLVATLLGGAQLDDATVERLATRTRGNPFAIAQYIRSLLDAGILRPAAQGWEVDHRRFDEVILSSDVVQLIIDRVSRLDPKSSQVLSAAAVIGMTFSSRLLQDIAGERAAAVRNAMADAVRAGLVEQIDADVFALVHDRIREALLARLSAELRKDFHQTIAENMDAGAVVGETSTDQIYSLARHYLQGHPEKNPKRTFETSLDAGLEALKAFACGEAIGFLAHADSLRADLEVDRASLFALHEALALSLLQVGDFDAAEKNFRKALDLTSEPLLKAKLHWYLGRTFINCAEFLWAWDEAMAGLRVLGRPFPRWTVFQILSSLWDLAYGFVLRHTGLLFGRSQGEELRTHKAVADLYLLGSSGAVLGGKSYLSLLLFPGLLLQIHRLGSRLEAIEPMGFASLMFGALRMPKFSHRTGMRAVSLAQKLGDRALEAQARHYHALGLHWAGDPIGAENHQKADLVEYERWLQPTFYAGVLFDLYRTNLQVRGHSRLAFEVAQSMEQILVKRRNLIAEMGGFSSLAGCAAIRGDMTEAAKYLERAMSCGIMEKGRVFALVYVYGEALLVYLEQDELGEPVEDIFRKFLEFKIPPRECYFYFKCYFLYAAYLRRRRMHRAAGTGRAEALRLFEKSIAELRTTHNGMPHFHAHILVLEASLARERGKLERAHRLLSRAQELSAEFDMPWGLFEVARERGHLLERQGKPVPARQQARIALHIAQEQGWKNRARWVQDEFKLADSFSQTAGRQASADGTGSGSHTSSGPPLASAKLKRQLDALLEVSLASSSVLGFRQQAQVALDKIVQILAAERAFLFLKRSDSPELQLAAGRDAEGRDLGETKGYSSTVVQLVLAEGKPRVVNGTEEGALLGSESAVLHDLRSIMAVPLTVRDQAVGVIYLDNRLAKGVFTEDDVEILMALGNHIAIALETARAMDLEIQRRNLEKDLALTATVQSFFLPRESEFRPPGMSGAGYYLPATHCGGDWWWHETRTDGRALVLLVDVTGHGAASAMVTATVASGYRMLRKLGADLDVPRMLAALNQSLLDICQTNYLMTALVMEIDARANRLTYWSAGAVPFFIMDARGQVQTQASQGDLLGLRPDPVIHSQTCEFSPGARALIFTDGLPDLKEAPNQALRRRGVMKLLQETRLLKSPAEVRTHFARAIDGLRRETAPDDDITFVVLDRDAF